MIKMYSSSYYWFAWRPVRLGFVRRGPLVWLRWIKRSTIGSYRFYEAL